MPRQWPLCRGFGQTLDVLAGVSISVREKWGELGRGKKRSGLGAEPGPLGLQGAWKKARMINSDLIFHYEGIVHKRQ